MRNTAEELLAVKMRDRDHSRSFHRSVVLQVNLGVCILRVWIIGGMRRIS